MAEQMGFDFGDGEETKKPTKAEEAKEKAKARALENAEYADKRVKSSPLIANAELEKMREILGNKPIKTTSQASMLSPQGNITRAGASGGGGGMGTGKMNRDITKNYKKGGAVKSASSRGDGCAQRGKTKGRMI